MAIAINIGAGVFGIGGAPAPPSPPTEVWNDTPTPSPNGSATVFTASNPYVSGSLQVYLGSMRQTRGVDYTETTSTTFTFISAPVSGANVVLDYLTP